MSWAVPLATTFFSDPVAAKKLSHAFFVILLNSFERRDTSFIVPSFVCPGTNSCLRSGYLAFVAIN
jgi:hypothetical protein